MNTFSKNFFFGAAISSHQVEGGNFNDWTEWERTSAKLKIENAKLLKWPDYILNNYPNPLQEENYVSGKACDHYHRFRDDFDIARSLGHNAHRFSVEWSRIEPEEGKFNEKEIEHYREVVRALRERGIEPFVTLWHWTHPAWFAKRGGWLAKDAQIYFSRFCKRISGEFKDEVRYWIILNEPILWATDAYRLGKKPPVSQSIRKFLKVYVQLVRAHRNAAAALKDINKDFQIGIAESMNDILFPALLKPFVRYFRNLLFISLVKNRLDFIGVNYYRPFRFQSQKPSHASDMGWEIYPEGMHHLLKDLKKYRKPIVITENGIADARDAKRADFIKNHIAAMRRAMNEGVDVRGYFYWSLLDNFEWNKGFWPRFGLVEIDYQTLERRIRPSAYEYKKIIEESKL